MKKRSWGALCMAGILAFSMPVCGSSVSGAETAAAEVTESGADTAISLEKIDMTKWQYNADDDVYYQTGISYCASPADEAYETLALENCSSVEEVDFETVWGEGHTQAERSGSSGENFIEWVNECMKNS